MSDKATRRILEGPLVWEVLRFGAPLALGMALQTTFNLVDASLIAQLPHDEVTPAVGALGVCDQIAALGTIVSYGVSTATAARLSHQKGAGNLAAMKNTAWQSMLIVMSLSVLFGLLGVLAHPLLAHGIGMKGAALDVGTRYLRVMLAGSFSIFFLLQLTSIQRALGSAKTPVALLVLGNVFNVVFAIVCLFGPEQPAGTIGLAGVGTGFAACAKLASILGIPRMGMVGAAWATIAARALVLIPNVIVLVRRFDIFPKKLTGFQRVEVRKILALAWPSSTQFVLRIGAMLLVNSLVARFYTTELDQTATTAMGLVFRVDSMALFVAMGWGSGAQTFVGQNLGANKPERAARSGWLTAAFDVATNLILVWAISTYGVHILRFFGREDAPVELGQRYLHIVAPSYLALGFGVVLGNAMAGAGATRTTLAIDAGVLFLFQVPVALVCVMGLHVRLEGLFYVVTATAFVSAVVYALVYARGRWKHAAEFGSIAPPPPSPDPELAT